MQRNALILFSGFGKALFTLVLDDERNPSNRRGPPERKKYELFKLQKMAVTSGAKAQSGRSLSPSTVSGARGELEANRDGTDRQNERWTSAVSQISSTPMRKVTFKGDDLHRLPRRASTRQAGTEGSEAKNGEERASWALSWR